MTDVLNKNVPWKDCEFIVLDLEGTGAQHKELEGIVEIAAIAIRSQQVTRDYFYRLINPEITIPPMVSKIHGLKNKDLVDKPVFAFVQSELLQFINHKILVGHNVHVDYRLLKRKMPGYTPSLVLDTKKISKHFWPSEPKHSLDDLIDRLGIREELQYLPIQRGRHSAYYDAHATGMLFLKMLLEKMTETDTLNDVAKICSISVEPPTNTQGTLF